MKCPVCGTQLPKEAKYCFRCGTRLPDSNTKYEGTARFPLELLNNCPDFSSTSSVSLFEIMSSDEFQNTTSDLPFVIGKDENGRILVGDLEKAIHLLIWFGLLIILSAP